jgi:hypothetical protein
LKAREVSVENDISCSHAKNDKSSEKRQRKEEEEEEDRRFVQKRVNHEEDDTTCFYDIPSTVPAASSSLVRVPIQVPESVSESKNNSAAVTSGVVTKTLLKNSFKPPVSLSSAASNRASIALFSVAEQMLNNSDAQENYQKQQQQSFNYVSLSNYKYNKHVTTRVYYPEEIVNVMKAISLQDFSGGERVDKMNALLEELTKVRREIKRSSGSSKCTNESLTFNNNGGDKSFNTINPNTDVLVGRGGSVNFHPANVRLRHIVQVFRHVYINAHRFDKPSLSKVMMNYVRSWDPPGRFMKADDDKNYVEISDAQAVEKISQLFRGKPKDNDFAMHDCQWLEAKPRIAGAVEDLKSSYQFP